MQDLLFMEGLQEYLLPYVVVQIVAILFLYVSFRNTRLARLLFALLFLYASCINMYFGLTSSNIYLQYAPMALPVYRHFIEGWFRLHIETLVPLIAVCQFFIGIGMLLKERWVRWACIGAIIFLLSIAPLMVGAGFPFSLLVSVAAWRVLKHDMKDFLWRKPAGFTVLTD